MKDTVQIILIGVAAVILYDVVGSLASLSLGFNYQWLVFGSLVIYSVVGYFSGKRKNAAFGFLAGALMGLVDSTLGWYISWIIGPGKSEIEMDATMIIGTIAIVTILAALFGLIGGFAARTVNKTA